MTHDKANRLADELSPYLKQHAYNPVDWYPWGDEAFAKAREEDKPIFLSIGYSTCHWCHVMERESFEDIEVAGLLNHDFISIKVDREERPDIDGVYMTVTQMMTGGGGWPMTVIMTPDKEPFFAGTYIPKSSKWGRPGMMELLPKIVAAWKGDRDRVLTTTGQVKDALANINSYQSGEGMDIKDVDAALKDLRSRYDKSFGGFGNAPKFPTPHNLILALRRYAETDDPKLLRMVEGTLLNMRLGGIWDHVGFGFHRYSTDREWLLPHFEKMLYDQALLLMAYTEAYQVTGHELFAQTAREIMTYVMRDMQDANGGYYSAEDADSEGEEGKFYIWTTDELREHLGDGAKAFIKHYRAEDDGNFRDESSGKKHPANILHLKSFSNDADFAEARQKLFDIREKRIHPLKDRKVLTDWNGLMLGAAALCGKVLGQEKYIDSAERAASFILGAMRDENGRLYKRSFDGQVGLDGLLDDYAFMVWGLTELYEATWKPEYLTSAVELNELMLRHFSDGENGFFLTPDDGETVLVRQQEIYDGAVPSGNSVAAMNLLRLGHLTGHTDLLDRAEGLFKAFSSRVSQSPGAHTFLLTAVDFQAAEISEVVIYGDLDCKEVQEMRGGMHSNYLPYATVTHVSPGDTVLTDAFPHLKELLANATPPTAFVCRNFACQQPTAEPDALNDALK